MPTRGRGSPPSPSETRLPNTGCGWQSLSPPLRGSLGKVGGAATRAGKQRPKTKAKAKARTAAPCPCPLPLRALARALARARALCSWRWLCCACPLSPLPPSVAHLPRSTRESGIPLFIILVGPLKIDFACRLRFQAKPARSLRNMVSKHLDHLESCQRQRPVKTAKACAVTCLSTGAGGGGLIWRTHPTPNQTTHPPTPNQKTSIAFGKGPRRGERDDHS